MPILLVVAKVLFVLIALMMIGAILLQEGKGGGLAALGGTQAEQAFGASNPVRRMTVVLAVLFFLLCGFIALVEMPPSLEGVADEQAESQASTEPASDDAAPKSDDTGAAGKAGSETQKPKGDAPARPETGAAPQKTGEPAKADGEPAPPQPKGDAKPPADASPRPEAPKAED